MSIFNCNHVELHEIPIEICPINNSMAVNRKHELQTCFRAELRPCTMFGPTERFIQQTVYSAAAAAAAARLDLNIYKTLFCFRAVNLGEC